MGFRLRGRQGIIVTLGVSLLILFLALGALNAFNLSFLNPASPTQTLVFIALSVLAFLLFVGVLVLLVRNVVKLYADQRSRVLGTRLRTRMLWGAVLVSVVPLVFMMAFSYLLMNRAIDRWFSQPVTQMRDDSTQLAEELFHYAAANARSESDSIALELADTTLPSAARHSPQQVEPVQAVLESHEVTLQGGFAIVFQNGEPLVSVRLPDLHNGISHIESLLPPSNNTDESPNPVSPVTAVTPRATPEQTLLDAARRTDEPFFSINGTDYTLATSGLKQGGLVLVGLPIPNGISSTTLEMRTAADHYWTSFRERRQIRGLFVTLLLLVTGLALFACCWLALNLAKQVTRPVESLADAMEAIAAGDYAHRVPQSATDELGELTTSFNTMAADLEQAHDLAARSTTQLSELNAALEQRRGELETIIETIPNGVVTLSAEFRILVANRAFSEMVDPGGQKQFAGLTLAEVLPAEIIEQIDRLMRRAHRMGSASASMELQAPAGTRQISATVALVEKRATAAAGREQLGYVLVLEDATELLRAQKQSAWKEVARRVAHEIKNPLTPISLNAELIQRHVGRLIPLLAEHQVESPSPAVIQRCTEVISSSVSTMRSLVDQFSALAEFPAARPRPADLNTIVENSLALFAGRLGAIRVRTALAPHLPLILADPEALKRALSNLIDNAAEAMQESLLRELEVTTRLLDNGPRPSQNGSSENSFLDSSSSGMVELSIADTGPGLTDEMRDRLFLPYFSTKQRGTGLGLSIAAKIIQEHQGTIRAEKNFPTGARFILELKPASSLDDPQFTPTETTQLTAPNP
jgi:two-component system nitrogen regulation sensor histidine kinase NtrY